MNYVDYLFLSGAALSFVGALIAIRCATLPMRDSLDTLKEDFDRVGRWQKWAAAINMLTSAVLLAAQFLVKS